MTNNVEWLRVSLKRGAKAPGDERSGTWNDVGYVRILAHLGIECGIRVVTAAAFWIGSRMAGLGQRTSLGKRTTEML